MRYSPVIPRLRRLSSFLLLAATTVAVPAFADPRPAGAAAASADDQKKAQEHFQKARELYSSGRYGDALGELEIARSLDPKAKDLVMNLGIVNEKLGKYDEAISWFRTFLDLDDITAAEKSRAESFIRRIEGAKREQAAKNPPPPTTATAPTTTGPKASASAPDQTDAPRGRVDGATIAAGAVAGVGLATGITFGAIAIATRPSGFTTGTDGTYADLQSKTERAHTMAIVADIGFGVGVIAAVAALYLYFGRTKDPARAQALRPGGFAF